MADDSDDVLSGEPMPEDPGSHVRRRGAVPEVVAYDPAAHRKIDSSQRRLTAVEAKVNHNDGRCTEIEKWIAIATETEKTTKELLIDVKTSLFGDPRDAENRGLMAEVAFQSRTYKWLWGAVIVGYGTLIGMIIERIINHP